ncbi:hypothetical protein [Breznakiella homolactica]|uniref:Uncharacterized protein n=1 Tax=Breznakiella homolactica TaxID=2798577 RepID=A0A7T8BBQ9_9SPIR|nr:hypothetical protein [Breznakiella homolactica]QQO10325.1 hypothetical protein JFL75_05235 [Breznakiella homolactica]
MQTKSLSPEKDCGPEELPFTIRLIMRDEPLLVSCGEAETQIIERLGFSPREFLELLEGSYPGGVSVPFLHEIMDDYENGIPAAVDLLEGRSYGERKKIEEKKHHA